MSTKTIDKAENRNLDATDGAWVAICDDHGTIVNVVSRNAARSTSTLDFCDVCREAEAEKHATPSEPKPLTRKECLAALAEAGYEGPVSYTMTVLRELVQWAQAGMPKDAAVPAGAIAAVYPEAKPAKQPQRKSYADALTDLLALLDSGADLDVVRQFAEGKKQVTVAA